MRLADLEQHFTDYTLGKEERPPKPLAEGIDNRRLSVYRDLVLATLRGPLVGGFPYTRRALGEAHWQKILWAFYDDHPPQAWELNRLVAAFPQWLREVYLPQQPDIPPYAADLADYERLEVATYLAPDEPWEGQPALNPTLALRLYAFDIAGWVKHTDGKLQGAPTEGDTHTAIYRDPETLLVRFLQLNPLSAAVLTLLSQGITPEGVAEQLCEALGLEMDAAATQLRGLLTSLDSKGVLKLR